MIAVHLLPVLSIAIPRLLLPLPIRAVLPVSILVAALHIPIPVGIHIVLLRGRPGLTGICIIRIPVIPLVLPAYILVPCSGIVLPAHVRVLAAV